MLKRIRLKIKGGVQGVGFRPFVYRLAVEVGLTGWVRNSPAGVEIEAQGSLSALDTFETRMPGELPSAAFIKSLDRTDMIVLKAEDSFRIVPSGSGEATAVIMADMATCKDCVKEVFDPGNRRYLYPFTNCTNCGPRFSIIKSLPYDRENTSMSSFRMCPECLGEYSDPLDRRYHAQPNACPVCGPRVFLADSRGLVIRKHHEAVEEACAHIAEGKIVAVKGLGGFHLFARADSEESVGKLRKRKDRPFKPFAVMIPDRGKMETPPETDSLLLSAAAPIVLVDKSYTEGLGLSRLIAPGNSSVGIMLPYTPLHHIMMSILKLPVVATSGNRSREPLCISGSDAIGRLAGIADFFLDNNRPIVRPVDDSLAAVSRNGTVLLRRSRGYAPLPVSVPGLLPGGIALGGNERNTIALTLPDSVVVSQYLGDMTDRRSLEAAALAAEQLAAIYSVTISREIVDAHPDYSVRNILKGPGTEVQHHFAHVLSCMAENGLPGPVLGVVWDGSGYGTDGTVWGGEFLSVKNFSDYTRFASFRKFQLPGGEKAVIFPPRTAAGMFHAAGRRDLEMIPGVNVELGAKLLEVMKAGVNCPLTSSVGRLFDGVAAILGLCMENSYSGQAAIALQSAALPTEESYTVLFCDGTVDWTPGFKELLNDVQEGVAPGIVSGKFHNWLSDCAVEVAAGAGERTVVLTGGCFQNTILLDRCAGALRAAGHDVYTNHSVPPGDGGLSLGQAVAFFGGA